MTTTTLVIILLVGAELRQGDIAVVDFHDLSNTSPYLCKMYGVQSTVYIRYPQRYLVVAFSGLDSGTLW